MSTISEIGSWALGGKKLLQTTKRKDVVKTRGTAPYAKTMRFGGKVYRLAYESGSKRDADSNAARIRRNGYSARVVRNPGNRDQGYCVYIRKTA